MFARDKFSEREAWMWLISSAAWKETRVRSGRKIVNLERGQLVFSERFLAVKWRWSKTTVRRFIERLKAEAMVDTKADRDSTLITICNYSQYQLDGTTRGPLADHSRTKEEEPKKRKEEAASAVPAKIYAFESGIIKLNQKDFDQWTKAFVHLNLPAKLLAMTDWAGKQQNWFHALKSALAKQDALAFAESQRTQPQPFKWNGMEGVI